MIEIRIQPPKILLEIGEKFLIGPLLAIIGYIYTPIVIVSYYKYETQLLFFCTGLWLISITFGLSYMYNLTLGFLLTSDFGNLFEFLRKKPLISKTYTNRYVISLVSLNIISAYLLYNSYNILKAEFDRKYDPLFYFFIENYISYILISILVLIVVLVILEILKELPNKY